jgi:hypothetical protein
MARYRLHSTRSCCHSLMNLWHLDKRVRVSEGIQPRIVRVVHVAERPEPNVPAASHLRHLSDPSASAGAGRRGGTGLWRRTGRRRPADLQAATRACLRFPRPIASTLPPAPHLTAPEQHHSARVAHAGTTRNAVHAGVSPARQWQTLSSLVSVPPCGSPRAGFPCR